MLPLVVLLLLLLVLLLFSFAVQRVPTDDVALVDVYKRPQHSIAHSFRTAAVHFVAQVRVIDDMGKNGTMYSIERNKIRKKTATKTTMTTNHTLTMQFNNGNSTIMCHTLAGWLTDWLVENKKSSAFVYLKSKIPLFVFASVRCRSIVGCCFFWMGNENRHC